MRPIDRGDPPRTYDRYGDAIDDLEERLGLYCSYCERHFRAGLEVEHVSPKIRDSTRITDWTNFLLACKNCNTAKGKKLTDDDNFLWPDKDNTLRALSYKLGGLVGTHDELSDSHKTKSQNLIDLVGLDRHPGQPRAKQPRRRDKRFKDREAIWKLAEIMREAIERNPSEDLKFAALALAKAEGFFGVWMTVFEGNSEMRKRFVDSFPGTALNCFTTDGSCIQRPQGRV